jgi:transcriptional regulator with XRE-family HTH domain
MDHINEAPTKLTRRVDEHVGTRIMLRRTLLGLKQEQLAAALIISYQQIQKYETEANRVSAGRLFQIAQRLGIEVFYFFDGLDLSLIPKDLPHGGTTAWQSTWYATSSRLLTRSHVRRLPIWSRP